MVFADEHIDWSGNAGRLLEQLARRLPAEPKLDITVFGSAPLQLFIERNFISDDIDLFTSEPSCAYLEDFVVAQNWGKNQTDFYVQVCDPLAFRSTHDWKERVVSVNRHGHRFHFVHPWDILVSKLQRLEEKDLNAFRLVIAKTGHPTEAEFLGHLQKAVDLYRPKFDEESAHGDMLLNTRNLWRELWGREIDPRAEILRPAIERANRTHSDFDPTLKDRLREVAVPYRVSHIA
ncbi:MAG TPA: hypothetical protein PLX89_23540 [Verrucomicrobiota bacterium]|nr:hypothetical protein [Verrucomicrobiota bacterium]